MSSPEQQAGPGPGVPPPPTQGEPGTSTTLQIGLMGKAKRLVRIVFAFTLITIAALFGLVPLIPGWPLALLGLSLLAAEFVWARRLMKKIRGGAQRLKDAALWTGRKREPPATAPAPKA